MENDQEESNNPDGIRKRISNKFKTIAAETKAIKERNHALAISLFFLSLKVQI
jgi:hypothetical protein